MTDLAYADDEIIEDQLPEENATIPLDVIAGQGIDLAMHLDSQTLETIARKCIEAYDRDKSERTDWEEQYDKIMELVRSERKAKTFPWAGASNAKYPLIMSAALQFGARAYPAIVNGSDVVKAAALGEDSEGAKRERGDRVTAHMNYQLLHEMPEWDADTDRLCHALPIQGVMFRQVVWNETYDRPHTRLITGKKFVVTQNAKDLETVPHFAIEFEVYPHELTERMKLGQYREVDLKLDPETEKAGEQDMLECHCRYDLDGDGYPEPYIAIIHKESEEILSLKAGFWPKGIERAPFTDEERMMAAMQFGGQMLSDEQLAQVLDPKPLLRVRRHVEFIKYEFLPDPEGKFYGIGIGHLLKEHSELVNTMLNQLIDAATDQNAGGGFLARGVDMAGGVVDIAPGEWMFLNVTGQTLRENIVPRPTSQPSPVLFQLLGMIIDAAKDLASNQDVMNGEAPTNQPATTTLAMIEEGMRVFSSIYKRIYRSLTDELQLIAMLNAAYLSKQSYINVLDEPEADPKADYSELDKDILPVADPSITTSAQKMARASFLMQLGAGNPMLDQQEILRRVLEAASIDDIESLMPQPDPQEQAMQQETMKMELRKAMAEVLSEEADAAEGQASAMLKQVEANVKAQEAAINLAAMRMSMMNLMGMTNGQPAMGGMAGMAGVPAGPAPVQGIPGAGGGLQGPMAAGGMGQPGPMPAPFPDQGPGLGVGVPGQAGPGGQ